MTHSGRRFGESRPQGRLRLRPLAVAAAALLAAGAPLLAQEPDAGRGTRIGVMFGGVSTIALTVEFFRDDRSLDVVVGTWSFRDVSLALAAKQYLGAGDLRPFVGGGIWLVSAKPPDGRLGLGVVLYAPLGADWRAVGRHHVGAQVNVNRALWVRRTDPEDDLPLNRRLVPLPGVYYRWSR